MTKMFFVKPRTLLAKKIKQPKMIDTIILIPESVEEKDRRAIYLEVIEQSSDCEENYIGETIIVAGAALDNSIDDNNNLFVIREQDILALGAKNGKE